VVSTKIKLPVVGETINQYILRIIQKPKHMHIYNELVNVVQTSLIALTSLIISNVIFRFQDVTETQEHQPQ
jgi:hypothetical protein